MGYTKIVNAGGVGSATADTTGCDVIYVMRSGNVGSSISDSLGNVWTAKTRYTAGGSDPGVQIYYCKNPTVGVGHTFYNTVGYEYIAFIGFTGANALPSDVENGAGDGSYGATSLQGGSVTPSENNEVIVSALAQGDTIGGTIAIDSGFTISNSHKGTSGIDYGGAFAYKIQTSAGAENPTWSWSGGAPVAVANATFKAAAVAGGNSNFFFAD